jgi:hypothetical protein
VWISITITTNGTAAAYITATVPVTTLANNYSITGRENGVTGNMLVGVLAGGGVFIQTYNALYPGGDGYLLQMSGVYEAA